MDFLETLTQEAEERKGVARQELNEQVDRDVQRAIASYNESQPGSWMVCKIPFARQDREGVSRVRLGNRIRGHFDGWIVPARTHWQDHREGLPELPFNDRGS